MAAAEPTILVVEDELPIVELITFSLRGAGWAVDAVNDTASAWAYLQHKRPQLMLLDWMLPDQSGIKLLSKIRGDRNFATLPIIMLTAKSMEEDKVQGLEQGADDYITKPFSPRELNARIKARIGPLTVDPVSCRVSLDGQPIEMGHAEFKLLRFLIAHPERVFTRSQLLDKVWGDHVVLEERTVDVHILRLRKALAPADGLIKTVRSVGYMLSEK
jgi:two-component system phosphate regulon response regulator PhoB